jgi:hypothetical protein
MNVLLAIVVILYRATLIKLKLNYQSYLYSAALSLIWYEAWSIGLMSCSVFCLLVGKSISLDVNGTGVSRICSPGKGQLDA